MSIFRAIVDSAPQAFLVVDGERQITLASRGAEQLFGYGPAELVGCQLEVLVPERLREKHPVYVRTFQEAPQARAMGVGRDLQARRKDGSEVSVEIGLTPLRTTAGSFTLAAIIDITERKRQADLLRAGHAALELRSAELERCIAERTLQLDETRRTLQTLLDALPSMIGYWDTGLINRFANEAYRNWFGDAGSDLVGKHLLTLLGSDLFEQNRPFVQAALQGKAQTFERDIPRPDGAGVRHALAHYLPDVVEGEVRGFCVLVHDITEITESKQRLARSLQEREVMLQEIHHRVKNNLQVVSSLLNLQLRRIAPGSARDALEDCQRRVTTIALVHEQLYQTRNFSRVNFGDYLRTLVANVVRTAATSTSVRLDLALENVALDVGLAIPCALVVNELVTNALKHAFPGRATGTVRVTFRRSGSSFGLEVGDDGVGLPTEFDIRQASSMGHQVVATLAAQLGASIEVAAYGRATFRLTFPDRG